MEQELQHLLFERIKQRLGSHLSLVNEIADVLNLSNDSAYRRLRGETAISLDEAAALAKQFGIPLQDISPHNHEAVLFGRSTFHDKPEDFMQYLTKTEERFQKILESKMKRGIYAAKDIPPFYFFQIPIFGQFKTFYWLKTIRDSSLIQSEKFKPGLIPEEPLKKAKAVAKLYFQIPFAEIWSEDTLNVSLRQVEYFFDAGWMASREVALEVCNALDDIIHIVHKQAEMELKWFDGKPVHPDVPYQLYFNDLAEMHNAISVQTDQSHMAIIGYNAQDYLFTSEPEFCRELEQFQKKQMSKSVLISGGAEKERNQFFNKMYSKISVLKMKIQNS